MGDKRTPARAFWAKAKAALAANAAVLERLHHVLWAGIIAIVLWATTLLSPTDQIAWILQSKVAQQQPSGEIIFLGTDRDVANRDVASRRKDVAEALLELDRRGAGGVYLDIAFQESGDRESDRALADAIAALGPRITIVDRIYGTGEGELVAERTAPAIAGSSRRVVNFPNPNYLGLAWEMPFIYSGEWGRQPSIGLALAGMEKHRDDESFPIDYGFDADLLPAFPLYSLLNSGTSENGNIPDLAGKQVVIGRGPELADALVAIPGQPDVPSSYVGIYAAETLKSGRTDFVSALIVVILTIAGLVTAIAGLRKRKRRQFGYLATSLALPFALVVGAKLGLRIELSYGVALLGIFALLRWRSRWKRRVSLVHQDTGLPTLRALELRLARDNPVGHVVIAKIHNYEHVLKTLRTEQRADYVLKLVDRLRAADRDLAVCFDSHFLGWQSPVDDTAALVEHLEGLRAIFAAPLQIEGQSVDVGITFGVVRNDGEISGRIPAAIAAAEETSEANLPIKVAETGSQFDMLWDISLRARIDDAMEAGEIYCVYQPKVEVATRRMIGVEALVRWHDPARGFVSPIHFIQQCENAGRMEHLTRYVLQSACSAGRLLHFRGTKISMAVNISATLLGDMRIVGVVRNVLQATGFDPNHLVLEVTETARIPDHATAAAILDQLKGVGARISMDDFGVGAANFEALFELPFDEVKIDRLFVSNMVRDPKARAIASALVAMGREARIAIVAEGAETAAELDILSEIGCPLVQGYAISRPISLAKLLNFNGAAEQTMARNIV